MNGRIYTNVKSHPSHVAGVKPNPNRFRLNHAFLIPIFYHFVKIRGSRLSDKRFAHISIYLFARIVQYTSSYMRPAYVRWRDLCGFTSTKTARRFKVRNKKNYKLDNHFSIFLPSRASQRILPSIFSSTWRTARDAPGAACVLKYFLKSA